MNTAIHTSILVLDPVNVSRTDFFIGHPLKDRTQKSNWYLSKRSFSNSSIVMYATFLPGGKGGAEQNSITFEGSPSQLFLAIF